MSAEHGKGGPMFVGPASAAGRSVAGLARTNEVEVVHAGHSRGLWYHRRARLGGRFRAMANIKQQKKRVRSAARQRLENLRYRSTVKTLTRRLRTAVEDGDEAKIAEEHSQLVRWIDRGASRGALHRNAAARKKSQAAKLVSKQS
jgi:small subunit ribosomal protein S20